MSPKGPLLAFTALGLLAAAPVWGANAPDDTLLSLEGLADFETAAGAPLEDDRPQPASQPSSPATNLVRGIQESLAEQGFYFGPIDGRMGPQTEAAIKAYQKSADLEVDGQATQRLANDLKTGGQVSKLLGRLKSAREETIAKARDALLANPETRNLIEGADAAAKGAAPHDSQACMAKPEPRCLLLEAGKSARDIDKPEMRDWALGEILAAQARAGLADDAMTTTRRIHDPRLIMVALRDIAKARADMDAFDDAQAAVDIIPDPTQQAEAYLYIVEAQAKRRTLGDVEAIQEQLHSYVQRIDDPLAQVSYSTRLAIVLFKAGKEDMAHKALEQAQTQISAIPDQDARDKAKRYVASSFAEMGDATRALTILKTVKNGSDDVPVLIAAATGQAQAGSSGAALITADSIEAVRYRALVLARIAAFQGGAGHFDDAMETLNKAKEAAAKIEFPFAKAYAFSRIALAFNDVGITMGTQQNLLNDAMDAAHLIRDDRLKAHIFWTIADDRRRGGDVEAATRAQDAATAATEDILSPFSRVWMLCDIAEERAKRREYDAAWSVFGVALDEAKTIKNAWGRARALGKVAGTMTSLADQSTQSQ